MATSGKLSLEVIDARLTRDTEFIGKMDPYVVFKTRDQVFKTKVHNSGGKTPVWNQTFEIDVKYIGDELNLTVFDEDVTTSDTVGSSNMKLAALCNERPFDEWFPI